MDDDPITPICNESRARKCAIHCPNWSWDAIWGKNNLFDIKPILPRYTGVRYNIFIVRVDVIIAPDRSVLGGISWARSICRLSTGALAQDIGSGVDGRCQ
jgi:hypothetical protein